MFELLAGGGVQHWVSGWRGCDVGFIVGAIAVVHAVVILYGEGREGILHTRTCALCNGFGRCWCWWPRSVAVWYHGPFGVLGWGWCRCGCGSWHPWTLVRGWWRHPWKWHPWKWVQLRWLLTFVAVEDCSQGLYCSKLFVVGGGGGTCNGVVDGLHGVEQFVLRC